MTNIPVTQQPVRQAWERPVVQKIAAGDAEVGTRSNASDGQFTTS